MNFLKKYLINKYAPQLLKLVKLDPQQASGTFKLDIIRNGVVVDSTGWRKNIITNAGKAQLALLAGDASAVPFTYLAVGTSSTAVAATDTALNAEITDSGLARAAATVSRVTTTATNDTLQLTYTWTVSGTKTVEEIGMFNASSGGTILGHALTTSKGCTSGDTLVGTYRVKFS
jgi:hypothetical protein